ncbi:MAG: putative peptide zinc metalloprotease protein [Gammaproteobacteria bacterium]
MGLVPWTPGQHEDEIVAIDEAETPPLAARLASSIVDTRRDLEVTRHIFRDEVAYVIADPMTFQTHRLGAQEYRLFMAITSEASLGEHCEALIRRGHLLEHNTESFYRFVMQLHKLGFLKLPIQDEEGIYERHLARVAAKRKQRVMWIFSAQIPLFNPDRFLNATIRYARPFFSRFAFGLWLILVGTAIFMGYRNGSEFMEPAMNIFSGPNLPLLWGTLIGLKVVHEFGHAYLCKLYGGRVPEMGIMMIAGAPLAYMDASSSWGFNKKYKRILVCLAGMYIEVGLAAIAMVLWVVTPPGVMRSVLHNIVMLASITTVMMNINPLMRYDGYYALTDAMEMPNLRARSSAYTLGILKRILVGVRAPAIREGPLMKAFFVVFGVASALYKLTIVLSISAAIASKFLVVGTLLGAVYLLNTLWGIVKKSVPYLAAGAETAEVRLRAVSVLLIFFAVLPIALFAVPLPSTIGAPSLIAAQDDIVVRAMSPGFLVEMAVSPGASVKGGASIAKLDDPGIGQELSGAIARRKYAAIRAHAQAPVDPLMAAMQAERFQQAQSEEDYWAGRKDSLDVRVPITWDGTATVIKSLLLDEQGRWIEGGEAIATLSRRAPQDTGRNALALFDAADLAGSLPAPGDRAWFQPLASPELRIPATVKSVTPTGSRTLGEDFLEHLDLATLALNPATGEVGRTQFVIEVELDQVESPMLYGATGKLRLPAEPTPLGLIVVRKLLVFLAKM